ncbi:MAG: pyridoxal-phosphate dependent enzyme [Pseudomonadota bacterium]
MGTSLCLDSIDQLRCELTPSLRATPTVELAALADSDAGISLVGKLELWQITGSFKARGALANVRAMSPAQRSRGVTAVSAGNHAIATAFAAASCGVDAKLVMTASAPDVRVQRCEAFGARVERADDVHQAFERVAEIENDEKRVFVHPFEGELTARATAGVGRELMLDAPSLDAVIVPVGGGGLAAGVSAAVKLTQPSCEVFGVEPVGANSMQQSIAAGKPATLDAVTTIADSLGAPMALPISFAHCQRYLDDIVTVTDSALRAAMYEIYHTLTMAVEPACAAGLAAARGPLRERLRGKRVGIVFCGSNIDLATWFALAGDES